MKRILIVGRGSSGKSTLARAMGEKLSLPVYHLDKYFWNKNWEEATDDEKYERHSKLISGESWIIEGSSEFLDERAERADTFIVLDFHPYRTLPSWFGRLWKYRKGGRPDIVDGSLERVNLDYIKWQLDTKSSKRKVAKLKAVGLETPLIILKNRSQVKRYLASL